MKSIPTNWKKMNSYERKLFFQENGYISYDPDMEEWENLVKSIQGVEVQKRNTDEFTFYTIIDEAPDDVKEAYEEEKNHAYKLWELGMIED